METLTARRGTSASEEELMTKVWNQLAAGKVKENEAAGIIKKIKDRKWNYSGTYYSVYFRVNVPIVLQELGFFGPFKEAKAFYKVDMSVFAPKQGKNLALCTSTRIDWTKSSVNAERNQIFYVQLGGGEGVKIEAGKWYLIQFMIDGPDTSRCDSILNTVAVKTGNQTIEFEFMKSSNQLPEIKFTLANTKAKAYDN